MMMRSLSGKVPGAARSIHPYVFLLLLTGLLSGCASIQDTERSPKRNERRQTELRTTALHPYLLTAVKQYIDALYPSHPPGGLYFFKPMTPHGCSVHPSVEDHAVMAQELEPFFQELLR